MRISSSKAKGRRLQNYVRDRLHEIFIKSWKKLPKLEADDIKSFRLRFATDGTVPGEFEINDISIIYRIKKIK